MHKALRVVVIGNNSFYLPLQKLLNELFGGVVMKKWKICLFSIISTVAIALKLNEQYGTNPYVLMAPGLRKISNFLLMFLDSLKYDNAICFLIFIFCLLFFHLEYFSDVKYHPFTGVCALVIAVLRSGSELFLLEEDLSYLNITAVQIKFVVKVLGYTVLLWHILIAFGKTLPKIITTSHEDISFGKSVLIMGCGLLPNLIIRYPGAICWDAWYEIYMYRTNQINAHHPMIYTLLLGKIISIFEEFGMANLGLFLIVTVQYFMLVLVFAYSITLMNRMHISNKWKWITMALCIFNPNIAGYIGVVMYDIPYTASMLLVMFLIIDYCIDVEKFERNWKKLLLLIPAILGAWNFRKNGPYVVIPAIIALAIILIVRKQLIGKKYFSKFILVATVSCILAAGADSLMIKTTNAGPDDAGSALSIPLQQTARICQKYDNEISKKDKEILRSVLDYDSMISIYNQRISDPVKSCLRNDATREEMRAYFKVWMKLVIKHPLTALSATWGQNFYFFTPEITSTSIYQDTVRCYEIAGEIRYDTWTVYYEPIFTEPNVLYNWKRLATTIYYFMMNSPVLGMISNLAMQTFLFILSLWAILRRHEWVKLAYFIPMIFVILIGIAAPVIHGHMRYVFVLFYAMPVTVAFAAWESKEK